MQKLTNNKGTLTIESLFIMIYVIGIVFLLIHISNGIYQKVYMQALADEAIEMAQRYWTNTGKDFESGEINNSEDILNAPLYIKLGGSTKEDVETKVEKYINKKLNGKSGFNIFRNDEHKIEVECEIKNYVIHKSIHVSIIDSNSTSFVFFRQLFGLPEESIRKIEAEGVLHDPIEFIRNLDLASELIITTEIGSNIEKSAEEWKNKMNEYLEGFLNE